MFDLTINGEAGLLQLSGEVDLQSTSELRNEINKLAGLTRLEIRAGDVSYIDSSGVAILLLARKICSERNIYLTISVVSQAVFRVLEIARLNSLLPIGDVLENPVNEKADEKASGKADEMFTAGFAALDAMAKEGSAGLQEDDSSVWPADDPSLPDETAAFEPSQSSGFDAETAKFDSSPLEDTQSDDTQSDVDPADNDPADTQIVPGQFG